MSGGPAGWPAGKSSAARTVKGEVGGFAACQQEQVNRRFAVTDASRRRRRDFPLHRPNVPRKVAPDYGPLSVRNTGYKL